MVGGIRSALPPYVSDCALREPCALRAGRSSDQRLCNERITNASLMPPPYALVTTLGCEEHVVKRRYKLMGAGCGFVGVLTVIGIMVPGPPPQTLDEGLAFAESQRDAAAKRMRYEQQQCNLDYVRQEAAYGGPYNPRGELIACQTFLAGGSGRQLQLDIQMWDHQIDKLRCQKAFGDKCSLK